MCMCVSLPFGYKQHYLLLLPGERRSEIKKAAHYCTYIYEGRPMYVCKALQEENPPRFRMQEKKRTLRRVWRTNKHSAQVAAVEAEMKHQQGTQVPSSTYLQLSIVRHVSMHPQVDQISVVFLFYFCQTFLPIFTPFLPLFVLVTRHSAGVFPFVNTGNLGKR